MSDKYSPKLAAKRWQTYIKQEEDKKGRSNKGQNVIIIATVWLLRLITYVLKKIGYTGKRIVEKIRVE